MRIGCYSQFREKKLRALEQALKFLHRDYVKDCLTKLSGKDSPVKWLTVVYSTVQFH